MRRWLMLLGTLMALTRSAIAIDIATCGITVPRNEVGVIQADMSCGGAFVVALDHGATLDLNGHAISLANAGYIQAVVRCNDRRCTVGGAGTITCTNVPGGYITGVGMSRGGRLDIRDVTIQNCDQGIWDTGTIGARTRVYATDLSVFGSSYNGIEAEKLVGTNIVSNGNGFSGLAVEQVLGTNITVAGNGALPPLHSGITSFNGTVKVTQLNAFDNAQHGVEAKKVVLTSSTLTGNGFADISSKRLPRLTTTTCGTSNGWGVCAND